MFRTITRIAFALTLAAGTSAGTIAVLAFLGASFHVTMFAAVCVWFATLVAESI